MLEDVNSVLNAGEIPNLFMPDEVSPIGAPSARLPDRHTCPIGAPSARLPERRTCPIGTNVRSVPWPACVGVGVGGCWGVGADDGSRARTRR